MENSRLIEIVIVALSMLGILITINYRLAKYQDKLRKEELKRIEQQVDNHLPTAIKELGAKLDKLIFILLEKKKDKDE